jgi:uncharacterized protein (DUF3084 family)
MNKVYIVVPLICLGIFFGFYLNFDKGYKAQQAKVKADAEIARKEKAKHEIAARERAIQEAVAAAERRKKEKEERDRVEENKKNARLEAEDRRQKMYDDRKRFGEQANRLKKEVEEVKGQIAKLEEQKQNYIKEREFLKQYTAQAQSNVKYYQDLLAKLEAAEKAKADAERAAAASKKS